MAAFCLHIIQVKALGQVVQSLLRKGAFELAPLSSLGYYSRLFYIKKALGSWRPILNLAFVRKIHHPEGSVSAFSDASVFRIFLRFMAFGKVFQFLALCLGLSTAPLVFTLLGSLHCSAGLHEGHGFGSEFSPQSWIRLRPYLHDWLIQASPRE